MHEGIGRALPDRPVGSTEAHLPMHDVDVVALAALDWEARAVLDGSAASPDEIRRAMLIVDGEARRMQRLAAELLDLSRLQAGEVPLRSELVDLGALAAHCADVLASRAREREVRIQVETPPDEMWDRAMKSLGINPRDLFTGRGVN